MTGLIDISNQTAEARIQLLTQDEIVGIYQAYNEAERLLKVYGLDAGHDADIFKNIKECQSKLSNAIDIALRCYCIIKQLDVPVRGKSGRKFTKIPNDVSGHEITATTTDFCLAIARFNRDCAPDERILTDVALEVFSTERREMNYAKHIGLAYGLKLAFRRYQNLCKVVHATGIKSNFPQLNKSENTFDFGRFDSYVRQFDSTQRRFVLIATDVHDIPDEQLRTFLRLPWSLIVDMDGTSDYGGLKSCLDYCNIKPMDSLKYCTKSDFIGKPVYVNLHDADFENNPNANIIADYPVPPIDNSFSFIGKHMFSTMRPVLTIVITGLYNRRTDRICEKLVEKFQGTEIVFLQDQGHSSYDLPVSTGIGAENIENVFFSESELYDAFDSVHINREDYSITDELQNIINGYELLTPKGKVVLPLEITGELESFFEILHMGLGKDIEKNNEAEFYRGNPATWEAIEYAPIPEFIDTDNFARQIFDDKNNSSCYYLNHLAGFGGSTLGRIIAWKLHKRLPVFWLHTFDIKEFRGLMESIYKQLDSRFIIIVDGNDFSQNIISEIITIIRSNEFGVRALFVQRISEAIANDRIRSKKPNEEFLTRIGGGKSDLYARCQTLLNAVGQEGKFEQRRKLLEGTLDSRMQCPLLINLYLLEENFTLEGYVKRFIDMIGSDSESVKLSRLLSIIAVFEYYGNCPFPLQYANRYLEISEKTDAAAKRRIGSAIELLLVKQGAITTVTTKHYFIARELLKQILANTAGFGWEANLPKLVEEIIDFLCGICESGDMDDTLIDIIACLFTDKTRGRILEDVDYTALLDEIQKTSPMTLEHIARHLADRIAVHIDKNFPRGEGHPEWHTAAHIYAQYARILADGLTEATVQEQIDDIREYCRKTNSIIQEERLYDSALEHMLGKCLLGRAKNIERVISVDNENKAAAYEDALEMLDEAIGHFQCSRIYGSPNYGIPGELEAIGEAIKFVKKRWDLDDVKDFIGLSENEHFSKYVLWGHEAVGRIDEINEIDDNKRTIGLTHAYRYQQIFYDLCHLKDGFSLVDTLASHLSKLDANDFLGRHAIQQSLVYAYEYKHFDRVNRRSNILMNAFEDKDKAKSHLEKAFSYLDELIKSPGGKPASSHLYKKWFEYAKLLNISLQRGYDVAREWKRVEKDRMDESQDGRLWPSYYILVISTLLYNGGSSIQNDVVQAKKDLADIVPR